MMPRKAISLRLRLVLVILPPLFAVSILLGIWRFQAAQETSEELFDRSLLAAALAISRDVAISDGDALSPSTRSFISDAGGGEIFYHVTKPGGGITSRAMPILHALAPPCKAIFQATTWPITGAKKCACCG